MLSQVEYIVPRSEILEIYNLGFHNELWDKTHQTYDSKIKQTAYDVGRMDAIAGDDVSSVDLQTEDEIMDNIIKRSNY